MTQLSLYEQNSISLRPLRPKQAAAIEAVRQAIREGHKRIVLQAPCSFGKTVVAAHMIAGALAKGKRPLFCVPRLSLINQTVARFREQGIHDIGVIQGRHELTDFSAAVQVASVQTLVRRALPEVDFVLYDEVHIQNEQMAKILDSEGWKNKVVIGLSATPWAKGMGLRWTRLIVGATTNEMIHDGYSSPVVGFGVPDEFMPDVSQVHTNFDGDYVEGEAEKAMTTKKIVGNVVKTWLERGPGEKTFMFCVNRSHARKMFEDAGVPCGYIDGTMDAFEREREFSRYRSGEIKILASIDTVGIGVDEDVRCIIYLRLTKSEMKWVQDGGRGIRIADGKEYCLLLDHAGTAEELGLFTDIHHDTLDIRDPNEKCQPFADKTPPKPYKCPRCNALIRRGLNLCPVCGSIIGKGKSPREMQGELVAIGKKEKKEKYSMEAKQEWYSGFLGLASERGKSQGWAAHCYRDKFGVWPDKLKKVAGFASYKIRKFERDRRIEYFKQKQKEGAA
jgi:DNA repair protein RadD